MSFSWISVSRGFAACDQTWMFPAPGPQSWNLSFSLWAIAEHRHEDTREDSERRTGQSVRERIAHNFGYSLQDAEREASNETLPHSVEPLRCYSDATWNANSQTNVPLFSLRKTCSPSAAKIKVTKEIVMKQPQSTKNTKHVIRMYKFNEH